MARIETLLAGTKIVDLSQYIPGPLTSLLLADMGAEVLKIEPPQGDEMRTLGPRDAAGGPVFYQALNAGKSVLRLDLKSGEGRKTLFDHLADADILIEGFRPGVMARLGLDFETLRPLFPRLIYCSISGYGTAGPLTKIAAHDGNYLATSGILDRNGSGMPMFFDPPVADMSGSLFAAIAILGALHGRATSKAGSHIDIGLADALMPLQLLQIADYAANGTVPKPRSGYLNGAAAYYQVYATADGRHVMLGSVERKFWSNFCAAAGRADWIARQDEAMPQKALIGDVALYFAKLTLDDALAQFANVDCCLSPVLDLAEALGSKQVIERGLVRAADGALQALFPAKFDGEAARPRAPLVDITPAQLSEKRRKHVAR